LQPLDGSARSAGQKADGNPQPDGAARHLIYSPPALFPLHHLLSPPITFVRFASAPSVRVTSGLKTYREPKSLTKTAKFFPVWFTRYVRFRFYA
jgi:hypothetical protein